MHSCLACGHEIAADADPRKRYCDSSCRQAAYRRRRQSAAVDLLVRQSRAVQAGDLEALAAITAEAEQLLG